MRFIISTTGLRVYDERTQLLRDTHELSSISFVAVLPSNRKVFAFIATSKFDGIIVHTAHIFKTNKKTLRIKELIGRAFTLSLEQKRTAEGDATLLRSLSQRSSETSGSRSRISPPTRPQDGGWTSPNGKGRPVPRGSQAQSSPSVRSGSDYSEIQTSSGAQNHRSRQSGLSSRHPTEAFDSTMAATVRLVQECGVDAQVEGDLLGRLAQLDSFFTAVEAQNSRLSSRKQQLQQDVAALKRKLAKAISVGQDLTERLSRERVASGRGEIKAARRLSVIENSFSLAHPESNTHFSVADQAESAA